VGNSTHCGPKSVPGGGPANVPRSHGKRATACWSQPVLPAGDKYLGDRRSIRCGYVLNSETRWADSRRTMSKP
ncbi:unnamed protein product, partial [Ectocarpus sp. 4 AP-2014]